MTNTNTAPKSIRSRVREAAEFLGLSFAVVNVSDSQGGRMMYSIGGSKPLTPGQAAYILGVE